MVTTAQYDATGASGEYGSESPGATRAFARRVGALCRGGEAILLIGDLGAGKTCFVQGLAAGLGVPESLRVTSPTFTIHAEYPGRLVLNHLDLYRLDDPVSAENLGVGDMLADRAAVTAVEWPEMLADGPGGENAERLEIRFENAGGDARLLRLAAFGAAHARLLAALERPDEQ